MLKEAWNDLKPIDMTHQESGQMRSIQDTLLKLATEWVKIEITNNGGGT